MAVRDGDLAGLFDIVTDPAQRRKGHAAMLVEHLLAVCVEDGATTAYLQDVYKRQAAPWAARTG